MNEAVVLFCAVAGKILNLELNIFFTVIIFLYRKKETIFVASMSVMHRLNVLQNTVKLVSFRICHGSLSMLWSFYITVTFASLWLFCLTGLYG